MSLQNFADQELDWIKEGHEQKTMTYENKAFAAGSQRELTSNHLAGQT